MDRSQPSFASALSTDSESRVAESRCVAVVNAELGGADPDLLVFFVTHHYGAELDGLGERLKEMTGARLVLGCTGASIVGGSKEVEHRPALSIWAACLPGTELRATHMRAQHDDDGEWEVIGRPEVQDPERCGILMLGDPYSFPMSEYLEHLHERWPEVPVVGGMASGGRGPGQNLLYLDEGVLQGGAVSVTIEGDVELCCAVSQGCRPIGEPYVITKSRDHLVLSLRGKGAAKVMLGMLEEIDEDEKTLFKRGPFVGIAIDATKSSFEPRDLLVRNIAGLHPQEDAIAVADSSIRVGQTVQFMVRDAASASNDMEEVLEQAAEDWATRDAADGEIGGLLFTCGGRGSHMFQALHHDAGQVQASLGPGLPLAGFFANGEIGPIAGNNFVHGFSASMALFRKRP